MNDLYWDFKEGPAIQITSGFRVYENSGAGSASRSADAGPVTYALFDGFDIEKEVSVIVPDSDEFDAEGGAAALAASLATALAALLIM